MNTTGIRSFEQLLEHASTCGGHRLIVVYPNNTETFKAIGEAARKFHLSVLMVGDSEQIRRGLLAQTLDSSGVEIVGASNGDEAVAAAVALARKGRGDILMKGGVDTATLMRAVVREETGLRTGRLISDVFVVEYPGPEGNKLVMITDGGVTLVPDLKDKIELIRNAVEVARALGNAHPRVAVLSASEFVVPALQSSIDAAALAKMGERGQIKGCIIDGPMALDNALSVAAAQEKKIDSPVAGRADILLAPSLEAANSLAKSTTYFAHLSSGHVITGAAVPILITSRADTSEAKLHSIALGVVLRAHQQGSLDLR